MGGVTGKTFVRNDKVDGQGKQLLLFAKKIDLRKYELDRIFHEFYKLAEPKSNVVQISRIYSECKLPYNLIASVLMQIFDVNKRGILNFLEYLMIMYSFLSTDEDEMARMCFGLFDIYK